MTIEILCLAFSMSVIADTALTYSWIADGGREANPFWARIIDQPKLVLTIDLGIITGVSFAATELGKHNKTWVIIGMVGLCLVQSYYLIRHYEVRHGR